MTTFKPTYLYIKQHAKTGKLYFGKTTRKDVEKYSGSGKHWDNHITYHGREHVVTLWYCLFYDKDECTKFATMFSEQQNIVESKDWLNMIVETGLDSRETGTIGYKHSEETKRKIGAKNSVALKQYFMTEEGKEQAKKSSEFMKNHVQPDHVRKKQGESMKKAYAEGRVPPKSEKELERLRTMNIGRKCSPERVEQLRNNFKGKTHTEEAKQKLREAAKGRVMPTTKGIVFENKVCPHCGLEGRGGAMKRYHFDNCKTKR